MNTIIVHYTSIDGVSKRRSFHTVEAARGFATHWVGATPELGSWYAVSFDGVGKVTVEGATLEDLFPALARPKCPGVIPSGMYWDDEAGRLEFCPNESGYIAMQGDPMAIYESYPDEDAPEGPIGDMVALLWTPAPPPVPGWDYADTSTEDTWPDGVPF